jgi:hypothetical protein
VGAVIMLKEIAIITNKATLAVANLMFLFFIEIFNALFYIKLVNYGTFLHVPCESIQKALHNI